jgi:PKD repeat protein
MVQRGFIALLFFLFFNIGYSQLSEPGLPESFSIKTKNARILPVKELEALDTAALISEDTKKGIDNRYGVVSQMDIDIKKSGVSFNIEGRGTVWQYRLQSANALSLGITFRLYLLPDEAKVFIYDESHTHILGAFTKQNNNDRLSLTIADLPGSAAIIEYFEPNSPEFEGVLVVGSVSQAYREISYSTATATTARIGINCTLGADWQDQKRAVCRMIFQDTDGSYYCTGFFVNNTSNDGTPYFMTANHCINSILNASTLVIYFNYENSTCSSSDASLLQTLSGSSIVAAHQYSDFSLVLMDDAPPESYKAFFLGWNSLDSYSSSGTCIHHPSGTPKCISVDNSAPVNYAGRINWDNSYVSNAYTHWQVIFDQGSTEGGSSGSPLMDSNTRVIGQLHGGGDTDSYYGKFSLSWNHFSTTAYQLKNWLDPSNTGKTEIDGMYLDSKPKSVFRTNLQRACMIDTIKITDQSVYGPLQWEWKISPDSYQFINGTTNTSRNPQVVFNAEGFYSIELVTTNNHGSDTLVKSNYVSIVNNVAVSMSGLPSDSTICGCNLNSYKLSTTGAVNYTYTLERTDKITYTSNGGEIYLTVIPDVKKEGSFRTWLKIKGSIGSCFAKDSALLKVVMPANDNKNAAVRLLAGKSGYFPGKCASVESREPYPSLTDCTSGTSWCPLSSTVNADSVLNGTLWFTFVGPSNGKINIRTYGSNSRIAVYEADSYANMVSSNSSGYTILAANDNVSSSDKTSFIKDLKVEPGKIYWLQLDGDNLEPGNYMLELWSGSVEVYPNQSDGNFDLIISSEKEGVADIRIISEQGRIMYATKHYVTSVDNRFTFDLSTLSSGFYMVQVFINGTVMKSKFVINK